MTERQDLQVFNDMDRIMEEDFNMIIKHRKTKIMGRSKNKMIKQEQD